MERKPIEAPSMDDGRRINKRIRLEDNSPVSEQEIHVHASYEEEDIDFGLSSPISDDKERDINSPGSNNDAEVTSDGESFPLTKLSREQSSRRRKDRHYRGGAGDDPVNLAESGGNRQSRHRVEHREKARDRNRERHSPLLAVREHRLQGDSQLKRTSSERTSPYFPEGERYRREERVDRSHEPPRFKHLQKSSREDSYERRGRAPHHDPREMYESVGGRKIEIREVRHSSRGRKERELSLRDERRSSLKRNSHSPRISDGSDQRMIQYKAQRHRERGEDRDSKRRRHHHRHHREGEVTRRSPLSIVSDIHARNKPSSEQSSSESELEDMSRTSSAEGDMIDVLIKDLKDSNSSSSNESTDREEKMEEQSKPVSEGEIQSPPPEIPPDPHVMRSKFDTDDEASEEETAEKSEGKTLVSRKGYSGYDQALSEDELSGGSDHEVTKEENMECSGDLPADLSHELDDEDHSPTPEVELPCYYPGLMGCRSVDNYEKLNRIEEGAYGIVFRAKDMRTGEVVALKRLKMEKEKEGFPITSLREINMLLKAKHPNVVHVREIVVGSNMDKIFIVMDYVEHDLKALMETMRQPFLPGEVKTLILQLLRAVHHLHDNWILHRDLKASNLLLSHKGILKVGDFGLAREYGSPLKQYTPVVVTLWYRAPELLLGTKEYSTAVDMWSVGCIFAEFILQKPLFQGKSEIDQLNLIFKELGNPNDQIWPGYSDLPIAKKVTFARQPYNNLRKKFPYLTNNGFDLLNRLLTYDPKKRISAKDALEHTYFKEPPMMVPPSMFPTWPAKSEMDPKKKRAKSPTPPEGGAFQLQVGEEGAGPGFSLKF